MSDIRDTNHDGKVSLVEKVKDKLHIGHKDNSHTNITHHTNAQPLATALPVAVPIGAIPITGTIPMMTAMPVAAALPLAGTYDLHNAARASEFASASHSTDSRDLNRDGHISASESFASATSRSNGFNDSRGGHIATSSHFGGNREHEEAHLKLHEEQLAISKREVEAGEVDIHKRVQQEHVQQTIPVRREEVTVERRALTGPADRNARIAAQDEVVCVPLFREEVVTEKRLVPTEEVIVRKQEVIDNQTVSATLRSEYVETRQINSTLDRDSNREHLPMGLPAGNSQGAYGDIRDTNRDGHVSMGEKLHGAALPAVGRAARG